jgi:dTDP-glucose 4,6-dehydratase
VYDEAKRFAESLTMAYHRHYGLDTCIARIFNTYGPRMDPNDGRAVPNFLKQALRDASITVYGDGSQTRSFCYVDDLIQGLVDLGSSGFHDPVNLGNPDERAILELAETIIEMTNSKSRVVFGDLPEDDPMVRCPDISRAREVLGWEPKVPLREGLGRTIEWFRQSATP